MIEGFKRRTNMKHTIKIYIEEEDARRLRGKASECGFNGRGALSYYITKIAREQIAFLDENVIKLMRAIKVQEKKK